MCSFCGVPIGQSGRMDAETGQGTQSEGRREIRGLGRNGATVGTAKAWFSMGRQDADRERPRSSSVLPQ